MRCPTLKDLPPAPPGKTGWPWTVESPPLADVAADGRPWPKISIVTPSFNQGRFIEETIRSVLLQGYPNLEYIIMDGGSTDETVRIIRKYENWISSWTSEPDGGQADGINRGWQSSHGEVLAWINSDDTYCPGGLGSVGKTFGENGRTMVLCGAGNTLDETGRHILSSTKPSSMNPYEMIATYGAIPSQPSVFIRKKILEDVGYLNPRLHHVMDWEFWLRIGFAYEPHQFKKTDAVLSNYRQWPDTKTSKGLTRPAREIGQVLDGVFGKYPADPRLMKIKKQAYSAMYHSQALRARDQVATALAVRSLLHAWVLAPSRYDPRQEFLLLLSVMAGKRKRRAKKGCLPGRSGKPMPPVSHPLETLKRLLPRALGCRMVGAPFRGSGDYWEARYATGGDSGTGSYGYLARYKAQVINTFVRDNHIQTVIEFGCGDGNQLACYEIPQYVGIDVSAAAVSICKEKFSRDPSKRFLSYQELMENPQQLSAADLALSIDVLYHLVEDQVFEAHIRDLCHFGKRFVIIYSTNFDRTYDQRHHVDRTFTPYVEKHVHDFALKEKIINPHKGEDTMSDFYIYEKRCIS